MKILHISKTFFEFLNSNNIRYCHWKSNLYLEKALNGKTDLDILIHNDDKSKFEHACKKLNFIKVLSPSIKQFPGLEDYLGFDYDTGRLIHLHIHYNLILGQRYIKNHHLPIERIVFKNLTFKKRVAIPCPELELILLVIRAHMKIDLASFFKHGIREFQGKAYSPFPAHIDEEMSQLINQCNLKKFRDILFECNLPISATSLTDFLKKYSCNRYRCYDAIKMQRQIFASLKKFKRNKGVSVIFKYLYFSLLNSRGLRIFLKPNKKRLVGEGKIFSMVGADGSGKSTLIRDLERWMSWKLSVSKYYYGIPKTSTIKFIDIFVRISRKLQLQFLTITIANFYWYFISKNRYKVYLSTIKDKFQGKLVLTDRFPLKEFQNMETPMDGPRLGLCTSFTGIYFSLMESINYRKIKMPEYIFVLKAEIEELRKRKSDLDILTHSKKAKAVNLIRENDHVILINANKSYSDVNLEIKRKIWEFLYKISY